MTHICVGNLTVIGSDSGLSPGRCQAIIWTNAGIMLIGPLGTNSSEILIDIYTFSFKKTHLKMSFRKWRPFCLSLNVLTHWPPGRCGSNSKGVISKHILHTKFMSTSFDTGLRWMPQNTFIDKLTLVQVMSWCCQATSHYLNQCWPSSIMSYSITRPHWVLILHAISDR